MSQPLPQSPEAERSVLGAVLARQSTLDVAVSAGLRPEDFLVPAHATMFRAMVELHESSAPIDPVSLAEALRAAGLETGAAYLGKLRSEVPTAENAAHYIGLVLDRSLLREIIATATDIAAKAPEHAGEAADYLDEVEHRLLELGRRRQAPLYKHVRELLRLQMGELQTRQERASEVSGVPSGFAGLDAITCGLHPGELVTLAARPGVGKTSLAINIALHATIEHRLPVLFFSLEMGGGSVAERTLAVRGQIDGSRMRAGTMTAEDWSHAVSAASAMHKAPLYIDDHGSATIGEIRAKARRFRAEPTIFPAGAELGLVVVDYLQLVKLGRRYESREQAVAEISGGLKSLAREVRLPVLALAQLSRKAEERDGEPRLSDLRESGSIEADSDVVAFMWREKEDDETDVRLSVAKQRNGPTGKTRLRFVREHTRFESAARRFE